MESVLAREATKSLKKQSTPTHLSPQRFKIDRTSVFKGHNNILSRWVRRKAHHLQSKGQPFVLHAPGKQIFVVSSRQHMKELNQASPATFSMHAVAKEVWIIGSSPFQCCLALIITVGIATTIQHAEFRHEWSKRCSWDSVCPGDTQ